MTARFFGAVLLTAACAWMMALTGCSAEAGRDGRDEVAGPQGQKDLQAGFERLVMSE